MYHLIQNQDLNFVAQVLKHIGSKYLQFTLVLRKNRSRFSLSCLKDRRDERTATPAFSGPYQWT